MKASPYLVKRPNGFGDLERDVLHVAAIGIDPAVEDVQGVLRMPAAVSRPLGQCKRVASARDAEPYQDTQSHPQGCETEVRDRMRGIKSGDRHLQCISKAYTWAAIRRESYGTKGLPLALTRRCVVDGLWDNDAREEINLHLRIVHESVGRCTALLQSKINM